MAQLARAVIPALEASRSKGQAGRVGVVGGCFEYTGAPYFAAAAALRCGADLAHVFCAEGAAPVVKAHSPELIVHGVLREQGDGAGDAAAAPAAAAAAAAARVERWFPRLDVLVVGPGLGRDPWVLASAAEVVRRATSANVPLVLDADGLFLLTQEPTLLGAARAVLTPNVNEYRRLAAAVGLGPDEEQELPPTLHCIALAAALSPNATIVRKGQEDVICGATDAVESLVCRAYGSPRRCGGQGDVLAGCIATFLAWSRARVADEGTDKWARPHSPDSLAALGACVLTRYASMQAFAEKKRAMGPTDVLEHVGGAYEALFPDTFS